MTATWYSISFFLSSGRSEGEILGFKAANFHNVTISSQSEPHALWDAWDPEPTFAIE